MTGDELTIESTIITIALTLVLAGIDRSGWNHKGFVVGLFVVGALCALIAIGWPAYEPLVHALSQLEFIPPSPEQFGPTLLLASIMVASIIWLVQRSMQIEMAHPVARLGQLILDATASSFFVAFALQCAFTPRYMVQVLNHNRVLVVSVLAYGAYYCIRDLALTIQAGAD